MDRGTKMSAPSTSGLSVNYCYELSTLNKVALLCFFFLHYASGTSENVILFSHVFVSYIGHQLGVLLTSLLWSLMIDYIYYFGRSKPPRNKCGI